MRKKPGIKLKKTANVLLTYAIILLVSIIFVFPILWVVLSCFSASGSIYSFNGFSRRNIPLILLRRCLSTPLCMTIRSGLQILCLWRR